MAGRQAKSEAEKYRERGRRLWKNYRITNEDYAALFDAQGGKCSICGKEPQGQPLNVDHYHFKIVVIPAPQEKVNKWLAVTEFPDGRWFHGLGPTKAVAANTVRNAALRASVRGLLCAGRYKGCNRLLGRIDHLPWLRAAIDYLENPPARKILDKSQKA